MSRSGWLLSLPAVSGRTIDPMLEIPTTIVIGGLTGSGKSLAIQQLESLGFVGIDALPPAGVPPVIASYQDHHSHLALVLDLRRPGLIRQMQDCGDWLQERSIPLVFLEARDSILIQRLTAHRRRHYGVQGQSGIEEAIQQERRDLAEIRQRAQVVVDTSDLSAAQLRQQLQERVQDLWSTCGRDLQLTLVSFGFKFGVPRDANLMFDVRFLPNPFFDPQLRFLTGQDRQLQEALFHHPQTRSTYHQILHLIDTWLPSYQQERRAHLTLTIGCTGGQHRSVALVERLAQTLHQRQRPGIHLQVVHRHLQQSQQELHQRFPSQDVAIPGRDQDHQDHQDHHNQQDQSVIGAGSHG